MHASRHAAASVHGPTSPRACCSALHRLRRAADDVDGQHPQPLQSAGLRVQPLAADRGHRHRRAFYGSVGPPRAAAYRFPWWSRLAAAIPRAKGTILVVHGIFGRSVTMLHTAHRLAEAGYRACSSIFAGMDDRPATTSPTARRRPAIFPRSSMPCRPADWPKDRSASTAYRTARRPRSTWRPSTAGEGRGGRRAL